MMTPQNAKSKARLLSLLATCLLCLAMPTLANESRTTSYTYNDRGQLLTITGPRTDVTAVTQYEYDPITGNTLSVTNALGHVTRYEDHTGAGRPQRVVDPNGLVTRISYDWQGRVVEQTIAAANGDLTTAYVYDPAGLLIEVHTPNGQQLTYQYDNAQRLIGLRNAHGEAIAYELDSAGNITGTRIYDQSYQLVQRQQKVYDNLNRLRQHIGGTDQQTTALEYDANSNVTGITDPKKNPTTEHQFDALNRIHTLVDSAYGETRFQYNEQGQITHLTDPEGLTTEYHYNAFGNLITQISPDTGITTFEYDTADNLIRREDNLGNVTEYRYDALNRLIQQRYPLEPARNILLAYDAALNGNHGIGRLTAVSFADGHVHYHYNDLGQVIREERAIGDKTYTTRYQYDHLSQLSELSYPSGRKLAHEYNAQGQLTALHTRAHNNAPWQTVVDDLEYLPFGPLRSLVFVNGITQQHQHDLDYRLTGIQSDLQNIAYRFDLNSNIEQIQDWRDNQYSQHFAYDALNRLINAENTDGQQQFSYDRIGNRLTYADQTTIEHYQYSSYSHWLQSRADINYEYDDVGNLLSNDRHRFSYNADGHLATVSHRLTDDLVADYQYNPWRQRIRKTAGQATPDYQALADTQQAIADEQRQIALSLQQDADALHQSASTAQQHAGQLQLQAAQTTQQATDQQQQAQHLQQQAHSAYAQATSWQTQAEQYLNQRRLPARNIWQRLSNAVLESLAWVAQGIANVYSAQAEQRDQQVHLAKVEAKALWEQATIEQADATEQQQLADDYTAQRDALKQTITHANALATEAETQANHYQALADNNPSGGTTTTDYVYLSNGQLLGEYQHPSSPTEYIYLHGVPIAMVQNQQLYFIHTDHLGTPHTLTDTNKNVAWHARHAAFGQANIQTEEIAFNLRFPGQYYDAETGLHYNWHRYYDPETGRYITSDPIGLEGGLNTYGYALQNPVNVTDPNGLNPAIGCAAGIWAGPIGCGVGAGLGTAIAGGAAIAAILMTPGDTPIDNAQPDTSNNDCDDRCSQLNNEVQEAKKTVGQLGRCVAGMSQWQLEVRRQAWLRLAQARAQRDEVCWDSGDDGHQQAQADAWRHVSICQSLLGTSP